MSSYNTLLSLVNQAKVNSPTLAKVESPLGKRSHHELRQQSSKAFPVPVPKET